MDRIEDTAAELARRELNPDEWEELTLGDVRLLDPLVVRLRKLVEQREESDRWLMDEQSDPRNYD
jgi:hypothetical protein